MSYTVIVTDYPPDLWDVKDESTSYLFNTARRRKLSVATVDIRSDYTARRAASGGNPMVAKKRTSDSLKVRRSLQ